MTSPPNDPPDPAAGLVLYQERLMELWEEGGLPDADYLCVRADIGTGFLGMKRITKEGIVALRAGHLIVAGEGEVIAQGPVASLKPKWLLNAVVYVTISGRRYGLGLTIATILLDDGPAPVLEIKRNAATQGGSDAGPAFQKALAAARGHG